VIIDSEQVTSMGHQENMNLTAYVERRRILETETASILVVVQVATESGNGEIHESGKGTGGMGRAMDPGTKVVTVDDCVKTLMLVLWE
jgi:lipopolysaccharide export system protein LptC